MTPIDAMRRLAAHGLRDKHRGVCAVCEQWWTREDPGVCPEIVHHLPDCPVPHLAGVVATLEAAADVAACATPNNGLEGICWLCEQDMYEAHADDCPWTAFRAALKGGD